MEKKTRKQRESDAPPTERMLTPLQWAHELKLKKRYGIGPSARTLLSAEYETASVLYGWALQVHHYGAESLRLTEKDFLAAMQAAAKYPTVRPHAPAIAEVVKARFADFRPMKSHKD